MSERANPRWTRHKETRPDEIKDAARKVFGEKGAAARLSDVAKVAGCSKGLILLYFGTKAELWWQAMGTVYVSPREMKLAEELAEHPAKPGAHNENVEMENL